MPQRVCANLRWWKVSLFRSTPIESKLTWMIAALSLRDMELKLDGPQSLGPSTYSNMPTPSANMCSSICDNMKVIPDRVDREGGFLVGDRLGSAFSEAIYCMSRETWTSR